MLLRTGFLLLVAVAFASAGKSPNGEEYISSVQNKHELNQDILEDAILDVEGLLIKYKYPVETHYIITEDGYMIRLHRIPFGKQFKKNNRIPVLLMHGLISSSADWVNMGPKNGFGYLLADEGYDVWMGNARGNFYSRNHTTMHPKNGTFWNFTWNEIGLYDLPKMIDYILQKTNQKQLHYIGHSQGTTAFFVMASEKPEYNAKIKSMQALAPVAYMGNIQSNWATALAPYAKKIQLLASLIGINEILPNTKILTIVGQVACTENALLLPLCKNLLMILGGDTPGLINATMVPVIMGHTPAGASSKQFVHYAQGILSGKFQKFDFGLIGNLINYKLPTPPNYNLKKITAPIALHFSDNDSLVNIIDLDKLFRELKNPIGMYRVPNPNFSHADFLFAVNVRDLLYNTVIKVMRKFD